MARPLVASRPRCLDGGEATRDGVRGGLTEGGFVASYKLTPRGEMTSVRGAREVVPLRT